MPLSDEDGAALIAELEKAKRQLEREKETIRRKVGSKKNGKMRQSWTGFGGKGRWAHPSTG